MKLFIAIIAAVLLSGVLFFLVPHHRALPDSFKPRTLAGIFRDFPVADLLRHPTGERLLMAVFATTGIYAAWFAPVLLLLVRLTPHAAGRPGGAWFLFAGLLAIVGAIADVVVIFASEMSFGFGASSSGEGRTMAAFLLPCIYAGVGACSVAIGFSPALCQWSQRLAAA